MNFKKDVVKGNKVDFEVFSYITWQKSATLVAVRYRNGIEGLIGNATFFRI
jgi:hypothetical protein